MLPATRSKNTAQAVLISVVFNDFDQSYFAFRPSDAYWYYVPDGEGVPA